MAAADIKARLALLCLFALFAGACSDSGRSDSGRSDSGRSDSGASAVDARLAPDGDAIADARPVEDANTRDTGDAADRDAKAPADAGIPQQQEKEPNDGKQTADVNAITLPVLVSGAIGSADDSDIFTLTVAAGDRIVVHVTPTGGSKLEPHLAMFADKTPPVVNIGGGALFAEYYALKSGTVLIAVRDRRNVGSSSAGVGDPSMTYTARVTRLTRAPIPVTIGGGSAAAKIDPPGTLRVFSFTVTANQNVAVSVLAKRLTTPSHVDTRLSLFSVAGKVWLGTNDDLASGQSDSLLGGKIPFAGVVHAIVANVATSGTVFDIALRVDPN